MTTDLAEDTIFAVDFAAVAREIAMDIMPLGEILKLHQLTDAEWTRIQDAPKFQEMLSGLVAEWNATQSVKDRVKTKASTGLESVLEIYIRDINDPCSIPLAQRVEAGKFLARLGELDGNPNLMGGGGGAFAITLNIGATRHQVAITPHTIEATAIPEDT